MTEHLEMLTFSCQVRAQDSNLSRADSKGFGETYGPFLALHWKLEYSLTSSAKSLQTDWLSDRKARSFIYKMKSRGAKTDPWGTPLLTPQ